MAQSIFTRIWRFPCPLLYIQKWDPLYLNRGNSTVSGGLYYSSGASGYNDWFTRAGGTGTALQAATLNPDSRYLSGDYRVIGQAFEVRSVGPELYKSGLNYMWRQPCANSTSAVTGTCTTAAGSTPVRATMLTVDLPPIDIAAAQLIPSTVRVNASEGGYVVSRFNTINPPIVDNNPVVPIMDTGIIDTIAVAGDASTLHYAIGPLSESLAFTPSTILSATPTRIGSANCGNFDISGSYFTGLNLQDVLNVTVKWIFQRYPSSENPDLVVLASPSPLYDPVAIEAYSRIVGKLPVGCPVRDNSLGDWFKDAASVLTTIAAPILKQVPHPYAQAASNVISSASKALRPTNDVKKVKKPDPGKAVSLKTALQKASKPKKKTK